MARTTLSLTLSLSLPLLATTPAHASGFGPSPFLAAPAVADVQPQWEPLGTMHSVPGDWSSPVWKVSLDRASLSADGKTVTVQFDLRAAPKCSPSVADCQRKIRQSVERYTLRCDNTARLLGGSVVWDGEYPGLRNDIEGGMVLTLDETSPLRNIVQPALCGSGGRMGSAANLMDTGITVAVIAGGGAELNPIGIPAKIIGEAYGYARHGTDECVYALAVTRNGGCLGTGATVGGLIGGPVGLVAGGIIGSLACVHWSEKTARESCYGPMTAVYPAADNESSWGNR